MALANACAHIDSSGGIDVSERVVLVVGVACKTRLVRIWFGVGEREEAVVLVVGLVPEGDPVMCSAAPWL